MDSRYLKIQLDDIIFESRNKAYGAYALRQSYGKRMKQGTIIGLGLFALLISSPLIATRLTPERIEVDNKAFEMSNIPPPPPKNDIVPPPPPPPPPPKQIATIRFVPPVVSNDAETEPPMPKPDEITVNVAAQTVEGEKTETFVPVATVATPPPPDVPELAKPVEPDILFIIVEQMPEFKDGTKAMFKYLSDNIKYPAVARENGIEETVYVGFTVWNDGSIRNVEIKRGRNASLNEEALRVVRLMPNWKAGRQNGKSVNVAFTIPIKFHLE